MTGKGTIGKRSMSAAYRALLALVASCCLTSCETVPPTNLRAERLVMAQQIAAEPPGNYFIGRRYFKSNYRFWGYIRRPQQPWSSAVLVMFNENKKLAPDRALLGPGTDESYETHAGFDNNYEYKLNGYFSGDKVYELVSNSVYPEFVLTNYELRSKNPPPIFPSQISGKSVSPYVIEKPL